MTGVDHPMPLVSRAPASPTIVSEWSIQIDQATPSRAHSSGSSLDKKHPGRILCCLGSPCDHLIAKTNSAREVQKHIDTYHPSLNDTTHSRILCPWVDSSGPCRSELDTRPSSLARHIAKCHCAVRPAPRALRCNGCRKLFARREALKRHQRRDNCDRANARAPTEGNSLQGEMTLPTAPSSIAPLSAFDKLMAFDKSKLDEVQEPQDESNSQRRGIDPQTFLNATREDPYLYFVGANAHHRVTPIFPRDDSPYVQPGDIFDRLWRRQPEQAEADNQRIIDLAGTERFNVSCGEIRVVHDDDYRSRGIILLDPNHDSSQESMFNPLWAANASDPRPGREGPARFSIDGEVVQYGAGGGDRIPAPFSLHSSPSSTGASLSSLGSTHTPNNPADWDVTATDLSENIF